MSGWPGGEGCIIDTPPRRIGLRWEPTRAPWRGQTARAVSFGVFPAISPDLFMPSAQSDKSNRVQHLAHLLPHTARRVKSTHCKPGRICGPSGFTVGAAAPSQRSDSAAGGSSCGHTSRNCVDLSLYGHRQGVYHRRNETVADERSRQVTTLIESRFHRSVAGTVSLRADTRDWLRHADRMTCLRLIRASPAPNPPRLGRLPINCSVRLFN